MTHVQWSIEKLLLFIFPWKIEKINNDDDDDDDVNDYNTNSTAVPASVPVLIAMLSQWHNNGNDYDNATTVRTLSLCFRHFVWRKMNG